MHRIVLTGLVGFLAAATAILRADAPNAPVIEWFHDRHKYRPERTHHYWFSFRGGASLPSQRR